MYHRRRRTHAYLLLSVSFMFLSLSCRDMTCAQPNHSPRSPTCTSRMMLSPMATDFGRYSSTVALSFPVCLCFRLSLRLRPSVCLSLSVSLTLSLLEQTPRRETMHMARRGRYARSTPKHACIYRTLMLHVSIQRYMYTYASVYIYIYTHTRSHNNSMYIDA